MTKQEQARQAIAKWLDAGEYAAGAKLPTILRMAELLGVKEQPVRQAVRLLVEAGKLRTVNGVGVFVRDPNAVRQRIMVLANKPSPGAPGWFLGWEVMQGIEEGLDNRSWEPVHHFHDTGKDWGEQIMDRFHQADCSGLIALSQVREDRLRRLAKALPPEKLVSADFAGQPRWVNEVKVRFEPGMHAILEHALELGHRDFGFIYGRSLAENWSHAERYRVFCEFCRDHDVPMDPACMIDSGGSAMDGYRATIRLLDTGRKVACIFAVSDDRCEGVMQALRDRGLEPGKDISVIGFDDMPQAEEWGLATVRIPRVEVGRQAVALLERAMTEKLADETVWLDSEPVVRASLGRPLKG
ncbi:MAG: GntR family transcriptional regulator [Kiritimatiellae bacterium]|nr:GntR family transcriptional regulator [Kiritimatiellia bacterium]